MITYVNSQRQLECISAPVVMPTTCTVGDLPVLAQLFFRRFDVRLLVIEGLPIGLEICPKAHY